MFLNLLMKSISWFFFSGISVHLSAAIMAHLFSYNITWGATKKVRGRTVQYIFMNINHLNLKTGSREVKFLA